MSARMYLPGQGMVDLTAIRVDRAVREYDERLMFAQHPQTGQWTIYIKIERDLPEDFGTEVAGMRVYPILAFPDIPHPDDALRRLYQTDTLRHGEQILDDMHRHNEKIKQKARDAASDAAGLLAEARESYERNQGETKFTRVMFGDAATRPENPAIRKD